MLHEVFKLLHYARAENFVILRMGTCGGLGIDPGTVVVSNRVYNAHLQENHNVVILGENVSRDTFLDQELAAEIAAVRVDFPIRQGGTMCTDGFFEAQARRDGCVCTFSEEQQEAYLRRVSEAGIINIEMESAGLASLCHMTGIPCAVVCVALLDRLQGDQVDGIPKEFLKRPQTLITKFIKNRLDIA